MTRPVTGVATCPYCGKPAKAGADERWRPFCSERCKMADLGGWFSGRYAIPAAPPEASEDGQDGRKPQ